MAGWMSYTKKVLSSALNSIAGELEQTAQDFNDAFHSLSRSNTSEAAVHVPDAQNSEVITEPVTLPPSNGSAEAGSIPEHMRRVNSLPESWTSNIAEAGSSIIPSPRNTFDTASASRPINISRTLTKDAACKTKTGSAIVNRKISSTHHSSHDSTSQLLLPHHSRGSSSSTVATATTRQPEPSSSLPLPIHPAHPLHCRLSQSSPSLSPISHEEDCSGASSDLEDNLEIPTIVPAEGAAIDPSRTRTPRPRAIRADQLRPIPFSVSSPCLVHVHKILPSCKKNFHCSKPQRHAYPRQASEPEGETSPSSSQENASQYDQMQHPFTKAEDTGRSFLGSANCQKVITSTPLKSKRPGKVVVVVSQPPATSEENKPLQEDGEQALNVTNETTPEGDRAVDNDNKDHSNQYADLKSNQRPATDTSNEPQTPKSAEQIVDGRSGSPQDQLVLRTVKSPVQIERQARPPRWPMLAPLARVLTFAYSQVVNAILLLQEDENSISSGNNRSRASSFSKELGGSQSSLTPPLYSKAITTQNADAVYNVYPGNPSTTGTSHRRQMSQISLAGSTFSSESFEILECPDSDSANFIYVGDDSSSGDILHEYHLFPSKVSLASEGNQLHRSSVAAHPSAITTPSFPINFHGKEEGNLMTTSSADFAHFDFRELISNIRHDKLNPLTPDHSDGSESPHGPCLHKDAGGLEAYEDDDIEVCDLPDDAMFESFVVLDEDGEIPDGDNSVNAQSAGAGSSDVTNPATFTHCDRE